MNVLVCVTKRWVNTITLSHLVIPRPVQFAYISAEVLAKRGAAACLPRNRNIVDSSTIVRHIKNQTQFHKELICQAEHRVSQ